MKRTITGLVVLLTTACGGDTSAVDPPTTSTTATTETMTPTSEECHRVLGDPVGPSRTELLNICMVDNAGMSLALVLDSVLDAMQQAGDDALKDTIAGLVEGCETPEQTSESLIILLTSLGWLEIGEIHERLRDFEVFDAPLEGKYQGSSSSSFTAPIYPPGGEPPTSPSYPYLGP